MNEVKLIGRVAESPVYHCTEEARDLVRLTLVTRNRSDTGSEERHYCQVWGPAAIDLHTHLRPGDRLLVRGRLEYRTAGKARPSVRKATIAISDYTYLGRE